MSTETALKGFHRTSDRGEERPGRPAPPKVRAVTPPPRPLPSSDPSLFTYRSKWADRRNVDDRPVWMRTSVGGDGKEGDAIRHRARLAMRNDFGGLGVGVMRFPGGTDGPVETPFSNIADWFDSLWEAASGGFQRTPEPQGPHDPPNPRPAGALRARPVPRNKVVTGVKRRRYGA